MSLASRLILLICSLAGAYFAVLLGSAIGDYIALLWSNTNRENFQGLWAVCVWIMCAIVFVVGAVSFVIGIAIGVSTHTAERIAMDTQELSVSAAITVVLLGFIYGAIDWPSSTLWYWDKWNILLVLALVPSALVLEQIVFSMFFVRVPKPPQDNMQSINRRVG